MPILKRTDIYEGGKALESVKKEITELIELQKKLQEETRKVNKSGSGSEARERIKLTKQLEAANSKLVLAQEKEAKELIRLRTATAELNKQTKLDIQISKAQSGSIEKLALTTRKLVLERQKLNLTTKKGVEDFKNLTKQINQNNQKLKQYDAQIGRNNLNVGNYRDTLKGLGSQILGAAGIVGGVQLLITGFTKLAERSRELSKVTRVVQNTFNVTNKEAKGLSSTILALAKNFDEDYNEIIKAANATSKEFGISTERSLALIEEGLKKGSNNSGEFLDILKEYPVQLKDIGLTAEESFAIINQQVRSGTYSDKGIDALKEAGINIRENNKAYQNTLKLLDKDVAAQVERERLAGNVFKAMQLISGEMKNLDDSARQQILSELFRGAGEDASSFVKNLSDVKLNLDDVKEQTSLVENANLNLSKSWNNLVTNVEDGSGIISRVWAGLLSRLNEIVQTIQFWNEGSAKVSDRLKENTGFTAKLNKALEEQEKALNKISNEEERRAAAGRKFQKAQALLVEAQRNLTIATQNGNNQERLKAQLAIDYYSAIIKSLEKYKETDAAEKELTKTESNLFKQRDTEYQKDLAYLDLYLDKLEKQRRAEIALAAAEIERRNEIRGELGTTPEIESFGILGAPNISGLKEQADAEAKLRDEERQKELQRLQDFEKAKLDIKKTAEDEFVNFASDITSQLSDDRKNKELNRIEAEKDALKDQLDKGLINQIEYQNKLSELNKRQRIAEARAEKRAALFTIAIQTAVAVAKAGFITPAAFAAGFAGGIQAAAVAARPLPKFKKGEININGPSHEQGGIIAEIEGGESMINKVATAASPQLLTEINEGRMTDAKFEQINNGKYLRQLVGLMSNMAYAYTHNGKTVIVPINGSDKRTLV